jgi:XTP/dITP diphosphohydrolase
MNPRGIHLATGNAHKVQEFQRLADESGLEVKMIATAQMPPVVEDTGTFTGNARKKALALKAVLPADAWVLADDSGLCVDALCGAPGVESAYFAGPAGDSAANLAKLVAVMRAVPPDQRGAHFTCVLVLLGPGGSGTGVRGPAPGPVVRGAGRWPGIWL